MLQRVNFTACKLKKKTQIRCGGENVRKTMIN